MSLMRTYKKILNKLLRLIQKKYLVTIFPLVMYGWLKQEFTYLIHHINRLKEKKIHDHLNKCTTSICWKSTYIKDKYS